MSSTHTARPSVSVTQRQTPRGPHAVLTIGWYVPQDGPGLLHWWGVTVTVEMTVTTGVGAVVTDSVMPQQEQADL